MGIGWGKFSGNFLEEDMYKLYFPRLHSKLIKKTTCPHNIVYTYM